MAAKQRPSGSSKPPTSRRTASTKSAPAKKTASTKRASGKTTIKAKASSRRATAKRKKKEDVCFVLSPFGGWHDDYHRDIFCSAINAAGLEPARADDLFRSSNIVHDIWHLV